MLYKQCSDHSTSMYIMYGNANTSYMCIKSLYDYIHHRIKTQTNIKLDIHEDIHYLCKPTYNNCVIKTNKMYTTNFYQSEAWCVSESELL